MRYFRVSKWEKFQHYDKPRPPWLKIYTKINDFEENNDWRHLSDHQLGQMVRICAHAAMNDNAMPFHATMLRDVLGCDQPVDLAKLLDLGVIQVFDTYRECLSREKSRVKSRENSRAKTLSPSSEIRVQSSEAREQKGGGDDSPPDVKANQKQRRYAESLLTAANTTLRAWRKAQNVAGALMSSHIDQIVAQYKNGSEAKPASLTGPLIGNLESEFSDGGLRGAKKWIESQDATLQSALSDRLDRIGRANA